MYKSSGLLGKLGLGSLIHLTYMEHSVTALCQAELFVLEHSLPFN